MKSKPNFPALPPTWICTRAAKMRRVFDCTAVCPYDNVPGTKKGPAGQERKALSRLGNLFHYWFRNAKRLFHLLIALAFMILTLAGAFQTIVAWEDYRKFPAAGLLYLRLYGGFTVFLAILCLYSFAKARSVR